MSRPIVYLAGPIKGLTYQQANRWRQNAAHALNLIGVASINPVGEELKDHVEVLGCSVPGLMSSQRAVVAKDRFAVLQRADAMLVNFADAPAVSVGTCVEFGWADATRIPIITILPEDNPHNHAFIREMSGWVVSDLEAALDVFTALFRPGVTRSCR